MQELMLLDPKMLLRHLPYILNMVLRHEFFVIQFYELILVYGKTHLDLASISPTSFGKSSMREIRSGLEMGRGRVRASGTVFSPRGTDKATDDRRLESAGDHGTARRWRRSPEGATLPA